MSRKPENNTAIYAVFIIVICAAGIILVHGQSDEDIKTVGEYSFKVPVTDTDKIRLMYTYHDNWNDDKIIFNYDTAFKVTNAYIIYTDGNKTQVNNDFKNKVFVGTSRIDIDGVYIDWSKNPVFIIDVCEIDWLNSEETNHAILEFKLKI